MSLALFALVGGFTCLAAAVTATDATRRGQPWLRPATATGCLVCFGLSAALLYLDPLAALYTNVLGRAGSAVTPRELFGLVGVVGLALTVVVLTGYGLLTRADRTP